MKSFFLAISFLTIIPLHGNQKAGEKEMALSLYFYPLTGFLIGGLLVLTAWISQTLYLEWAGDAIIIAVWIAVTGALHLDGLMDSADGLFSGREREKKLEIMRDSRMGAMGVIAFAVIILLKLAFLTTLPYADKLGIILIAPAMGRGAMVYAVSYFPYARSGPGLGRSFGQVRKPGPMVGASITLLGAAFLVLKWPGIWIISLTGAIVVLTARRMADSLGGMTGDTYGALCEITETLLIVMAVISLKLYALL